MQAVNDFLQQLDGYLGSNVWFIALLLGVGIFFTFYLGFPQFRYFGHAIRILKGKYDKKGDSGDTSHFQALATALSGTVGTGNIAGVALAIHMGGPAALFWMLVTALFGMTTKFVEVTLSHKYREKTADGTMSGGPMYYMKKRMNIKLKNGKTIKSGHVLGAIFAIGTILSTFGTGSLPQMNSISNALFTTFGINKVVSGGILAILLALVVMGGIKRIARVTSKLVPIMAIMYVIGAFAVLIYNYNNILPSFASIFTNVFNGTSAVGGFLGASFAFAIQKGVGRGLFSNEAGQGSAPIAHASARAHEPVSEGMVAILEPFIDTIVICTLTGMVLLSSGVWNQKISNEFHLVDIQVLQGEYSDSKENDRQALWKHLGNEEELPLFTGDINCANGEITPSKAGYTVLHARSIAENIMVYENDNPYTGKIAIEDGVFSGEESLSFRGESLIHSAPLTTEAFKKSLFGDWGQYIVSIGLLLFAFSTAISWSYYGNRAVIYLFGKKGIKYYQTFYIVGFFFAAFIDTTIIWSISLITIVLMTLPNLIGLLFLSKEVKTTIRQYWVDFREEFPEDKV